MLHPCNDPGTGAAENSQLVNHPQPPPLQYLCTINEVMSLTDCGGGSSEALKLYSKNKLTVLARRSNCKLSVTKGL